ncbi:GntR family transcriptional regulator [Vallitalea sediminicola]
MVEYHISPRDEAAEKIEYYIIENKLEPHAKIPSERDLCEMWGINRTTLRSAIKRLVSGGRLYNKKGSGTYVADNKIIIDLHSIITLSDIDIRINRLLIKVISTKIIESNKHISKELHVSLGTKIYEFIRLISVDREPISFETLYIPYDRFLGIDKYNLEEEALCKVMENRYNTVISGGNKNVGISPINFLDADFLNVENNSAVYILDGVICDKGNIPIIYMESMVRPDKVKFSSSKIYKYRGVQA